MQKFKVVSIGVAILAILLFASGCTQTRMVEKAAAAVKAQPLAGNPVELVNQLDREVSDARINQLNVLSPTWFKEAEKAYFEAKKGLADGKEIADIRENVIKARTNLKQAEEMATVSRSTLPEAIKAREMARSAGATKFEAEYARIEMDFRDLTKAIENNNLRYAQNNRDKVADDFHQLEVQAIKRDTIGEVRKLIAQAEDAGAKKIAPKSHKEAVEQLQATDAFITENPYAKEKMHEMAQKALFLAKHAVVVTEQSTRVKAMRPEEISLWSENQLHTISSALGAPDMRDQTYQTQLDNIVGSVTALNDDRNFVAEKNKELLADIEKVKTDRQAQVNELNLKIAMLEGKTREEQMAKEQIERERQAAERKLDAERRFNQKYVEVQNYFPKDEAEVYKQENQLVLRLKAVRFPVGKSVIMPENYALLSKVQKAIRNFNDPRVIIEGHTDSTGSVEVNQLLSQQRADAVREYMIANQTLPVERIAAVGYGSERPLASNATQEGRAINRRIDIIITPKTDPLQ